MDNVGFSAKVKQMQPRDVIRSQYQASLEMLKQAIARCPESIWDDPQDKTKFWHIAYHALFYTHLYLQGSEKEFVPWVKHRKDYNNMDLLPTSPQGLPESRVPYTKEDLLAYLDLCQEQVNERTRQLKPDDESGFYWLPFNKLELQIYNIRHIQQHAGELMERLGTRANIDVDWIGMKHD
jgi:hypothetical protein